VLLFNNSSAANAVLCGAPNAAPESQLGSEAVLCRKLAHRHQEGNWDLPLHPSSLLPAHTPHGMQPLAESHQPYCWRWQGPAGLSLLGGCWVTGLGQGAGCRETFQLFAINKVYAALEHFFLKGCSKFLYSLTRYLRGLCCSVYKIYKG